MFVLLFSLCDNKDVLISPISEDLLKFGIIFELEKNFGDVENEDIC